MGSGNAQGDESSLPLGIGYVTQNVKHCIPTEKRDAEAMIERATSYRLISILMNPIAEQYV
jgi:hypothetical protein